MKRYAELIGNYKKSRIKSHDDNKKLTANSTEANATQSVIDAIDDNIVGNIGLVALIAVMSVILFLVAGFASRR